MKFAELRALRTQNNISLNLLSKMIGVKASTLSLAERDLIKLQPGQAEKFEAALFTTICARAKLRDFAKDLAKENNLPLEVIAQ